MTVARGGGSDQRKAGAVRKPKPKPKDHGGIGLNNDGALDVVAPGDLARRNDRDRDITALVQIATLCDLSSCGGDAGSRLTAEAA